ncbi:olfactory receptor 11L1-like [Gastrophryne carolinensis]
MSRQNRTQITEFFLYGFNLSGNWAMFLFTIFLVVYILTIFGNAVVVVMVSASQRLQIPMYLFLRNLSVCEILSTSNTVPKMLDVIIRSGSKITFLGCAGQLYVFAATVIADCLLLTAMSYDRYLAIAKPLHYSYIMNVRHYLCLVCFSWLYAFVSPAITVTFIFLQDFCSSNVIDHFFCDFAPVLELSCSDTSIVELEVFAQTVPVFLFTVIFIIATYVKIVLSLLKISTAGRQKAFSTCSSHLTVVCVYYGSMISLYVTPSGRGRKSGKANKTLSLLYSVVTPLLNPIIYSLRNQDILNVLRPMLVKLCASQED